MTVFITMPPIPRTLPGIEQALSKHLLNECMNPMRLIVTPLAFLADHI